MGKSAVAKTVAAGKRSLPGALSLKVTLRGVKPPIWRRILVPGRMTLGELHDAIQTVMGWDDTHLHDFAIGGERFGDPSTTDDVTSEDGMTLNGVVKSGVNRFRYTYDFGDDWEHDVLVEKAPPANTAKALPACIGGKRNGPPEDCGGPWGYMDLVDILSNPAHPQHAEQREWLGDDFDPEAFSVADADALLAAAFNRSDAAVS